MIRATPVFFPCGRTSSIFTLFPLLLSKHIFKKGFDEFISLGENYLNRFQRPVLLREIYILMSNTAAFIELLAKEVCE